MFFAFVSLISIYASAKPSPSESKHTPYAFFSTTLPCAECVICDLHGEESYNEAVKISNSLFSGNIKELTSSQIEEAFNKAKECKGKPTCIVAKSVKGKGVSFMENQVNWHGSAPNAEQYETAMNELKAVLSGLEG